LRVCVFGIWPTSQEIWDKLELKKDDRK